MIERAVDILRRGGLVAFPTETVYGLGVDARNAEAVAKIFAVKGRPSTNPLIVHVADTAAARHWAADWPEAANALAQRFWPGPLTLVVRKVSAIVEAVSAGGSTVGLRVPNHPMALELLRAFDGPIAAPSANRSNRISPTLPEHVWQELGEDVDLVLNGGPCEVGIESTVLNVSRTPMRILRPGHVSKAAIEAVIGPIDCVQQRQSADQLALSPGQQETHYAPVTPAFWISPDSPAKPVGRTALLAIQLRNQNHHTVVPMADNPADYARQFYRTLRAADALAVEQIWIELPPDHPEWAAIRDRILRATRPWRRS